MTDLRKILLRGGQFTPASLDAAPLVVQAIASPEPKEKGPLLALAADLAVGAEHQAALISGFDLRRPDYAEYREDHPLRRVHRSVRDGVEAYVGLLASDDVDSRRAAPLVLAFLSEEASRTIGPVGERAEAGAEPDEVARASAVLCLGYLARYLERDGEAERLRRIHDASEGLVRTAAALSLVQLTSGDLGEGPEMTLARAITAFAAPVDGFPWGGGQVARFASLALASVSAHGLRPELLLGVLDGVASLETCGDVACALVDAAFGGITPTRDAPRSPSGLSLVQRRVLEQIVERRLSSRAFFALAHHGIPPDFEALRRFLAHSPGGPMDREVEGRPLWAIGLSAIEGAEDDARRWQEAVTEGAEKDVIAACVDALTPPFALVEVVPDVESDSEDRDDRLWLEAEKLVARVLAPAVSEERLARLAREAMEKGTVPVAAAALFAAAKQAESRGQAIAEGWDEVLARVASEQPSKEARRLAASLPRGRREPIDRLLAESD